MDAITMTGMALAFKQNAGVAAAGRPVSLVEAGLAALLLNVVAYLLLLALGLFAFFDRLPERREQSELHFTFAPPTQTEQPDDSTATGLIPGAPLPAAPVPDPAMASLDASAPEFPTDPRERATANPPAPLVDSVDKEELEPPSAGRAEGRDEPTETIDDTFEREAQPADELATFRRPPAGVPPPIGRPQGPSLDQRISDFARAVQGSRQQSEPSRQPSNTFEPDWSALPPTGQAIGNLRFESGDYDWVDYSRQIYFIIWRAWHNRLLARVDDFEKWSQQSGTWMLDHVNGVQFTIERSGEIVGIVLEKDSGCEPFDLSSIEGLDEALLPPLPEDFPRDRETVHVYFLGQGPIGSMRRTLLDYKRSGWF